MKLDRFSNVDFIGMEMVPLIFDSRPTFSELTARVRDQLEWNSHEEAVPIEGFFSMVKWVKFTIGGCSQLRRRFNGRSL